jgi:hypothetical protein
MVAQLKEAILPSTNNKDKVMLDVSMSSPSVTPENVTGMLNDHTKHMTNQLHYMLEDGSVKIFKTLSTSSDPYSVSCNPQEPVLWHYMKHWKILHTACQRTSHLAKCLRS